MILDDIFAGSMASSREGSPSRSCTHWQVKQQQQKKGEPHKNQEDNEDRAHLFQDSLVAHSIMNLLHQPLTYLGLHLMFFVSCDNEKETGS